MAWRSTPLPTSAAMRWASPSDAAARAAMLSGSRSAVSALMISPSRLASAVSVTPITRSLSARISVSNASSATNGPPSLVVTLRYPPEGSRRTPVRSMRSTDVFSGGRGPTGPLLPRRRLGSGGALPPAASADLAGLGDADSAMTARRPAVRVEPMTSSPESHIRDSWRVTA